METHDSPGPRPKTSRSGIRWIALLLLPIGAILGWRIHGYAGRQAEYTGKAPTFSGSSDSLQRTVIVPTLDSPCPEGRNVIWCSSFQLAWNKVRDRVIGEPLDVPGAAELAARLNAAEQSTADLDPDSVYAAGGYIRDGIIERIERDMAVRFPSHELPDFNDYSDPQGIFAYSYLRVHVPFRHPFLPMDEGLSFTDSQGVNTQVGGFGLWEAFLKPYRKIRDQLEIIALKCEEPWVPSEYAIDLCRHSKPYQVVVARVERRGSLAEMLESIRRQARDFSKHTGYERAKWFQEEDILEVPEMCWRIDHRFRELIGKEVTNVGMPILEALQAIEFRLDRSGAMVESEAEIWIAAEPRKFVFDRPFLVTMQKRGAEHPFFVMWVDNAELLVKWPSRN